MPGQVNRFLSIEEMIGTIRILKTRFEKHKNRHSNIKWDDVEKRLSKNQEKLWSLYQMEETGGEPDVTGFDESTGEFIFTDCSAESPKGRRSLCYDEQAWQLRKENKPTGSIMGMAESMGINVLNEEQYFALQTFGPFDTKTSSWLVTPPPIRKLGGAIFGDYRYGQVFIYHNGADSYYAARGFRGMLRV